MNKEYYQSIVFDFDGVILNSNAMKTDAYEYAVKLYKPNQVRDFISFHIENGGMSRYEKFKYFLSHIASENIPGLTLENLIFRFSDFINKNINDCEIANGLDVVRSRYKKARWLIVSGSDQVELRAYLKRKKVDHYFDAGIFGSPDNKRKIIANALSLGIIKLPTVLLGDSKLDHEVAKDFGFDFIFVSGWTDMINWSGYCKKNNLLVIDSLIDIDLSRKI